MPFLPFLGPKNEKKYSFVLDCFYLYTILVMDAKIIRFEEKYGNQEIHFSHLNGIKNLFDKNY